MKHILFYLSLLFVLGSFQTLSAQDGFNGRIPVQAVARDVDGSVLPNQEIAVQISIYDEEGRGEAFYTEQHTVQTDDQGYFSIKVGNGQGVVGQWSEIPWYRGKLWMGMEVKSNATNSFRLYHKAPLQTVPYAFTTKTANKLQSAETLNERTNFSIHWNTSGNYKTVPHAHYTGTRDSADFYMKTNLESRIVISENGQMTIYADDSKNGNNPTGNSSQTDTDAYSLYVKGNQHGIFIEIDEPRSMINNFVTFADQGAIRGRIEGERVEELLVREDFLNEADDLAFAIGAAVAISIAELVQGIGYLGASILSAITFQFNKAAGYGTASGGAFALGVISLVDLGLKIAKLVEFKRFNVENVGVYYSSGGADYAEYLKRSPFERDFFPGEVVGIHQGEISLQTKDADHLMVVSENPIMVGNLPVPEQEHLFEKVAFMGQVPVKVIGSVQRGDYLIPSGEHNGLAVAVNPKELPTIHFDKIIGVAWETIDAAEAAIHSVNSSVGMHANELAPRVERLEDKVDNMIAFLEGKEKLKEDFADTSVSTTQAVELPFEKTTTTTAAAAGNKAFYYEIIDQVIDKGAPTIEKYYQMLEYELQEEGIDLRADPKWAKILEDPVAHVKKTQQEAVAQGNWKFAQYLNMPEGQ